LFNCLKTRIMKIKSKSLRILIVEDNKGDYVLLKKYIERTALVVDSISWIEKLEEVEPFAKDSTIDLVFLDLSLADSSGLNSFIRLNGWFPHIPIVVLSGLADMEVALECIALGAQDYLMKGEFDEKLLLKSIQYSLERKKILDHLQQSNERYEIVNKATLDVIWDWDITTNAFYVSNSLHKILGYNNQNITISWVLEHIHPEDHLQFQDSIQNTIQNGKEKWSGEFRFKDIDGLYKNAFARGYMLFDHDGRAYRMIGAVTDMTEKKKLEQELISQQLQQQRLITETTIKTQEKERNELARELHDNINQVLATIKMFLNIAKDDETVREDLVNRSYENIGYAIEEIRKLSKSLVSPSLGDIGILEALQGLVEEINISKQPEVQLYYKNNDGEIIDSNIELMLYRVVQEQMNNIIKYAKAEKAVIALLIDHESIYLSIADNGIGFDQSLKASGIGLQNIASRVEFYSGTLQIETSPGRGCELIIHIPITNN
jgi:two-component system, NarL family, sensor histidine kinase UhpB